MRCKQAAFLHLPPCDATRCHFGILSGVMQITLRSEALKCSIVERSEILFREKCEQAPGPGLTRGCRRPRAEQYPQFASQSVNGTIDSSKAGAVAGQRGKDLPMCSVHLYPFLEQQTWEKVKIEDSHSSSPRHSSPEFASHGERASH